MTQTKTEFRIHTLESAPAASRPALERLKASVGMIPNLAGVMSDSPVLIEAFATLRASIAAKGTFTATESEAISLANAAANGCDYCTAIHATFGLAADLSPQTVNAIRSGGLPADPKLAAIVDFSRAALRDRCRVTDESLARFLAAGHTQAQALEIIARLALSVLANYSGRFTRPIPDQAIQAQFRHS